MCTWEPCGHTACAEFGPADCERREAGLADAREIEADEYGDPHERQIEADTARWDAAAQREFEGWGAE